VTGIREVEARQAALAAAEAAAVLAEAAGLTEAEGVKLHQEADAARHRLADQTDETDENGQSSAPRPHLILT